MATIHDNVRVAVRVRPFLPREKDLMAKLVIQMDGNSTTITHPDTGVEKTFTFDHSYWSHDGYQADSTGYFRPATKKYVSQRQVFDDLGVSVLENAWNGYNCSLFAYGQTGSGKSYSMVGYGPNKGLIPICCEEMFKRIEAVRHKKLDTSYEVTVSMLEIYNEKIRDLLNPREPPGPLQVRQDKTAGIYVEHLLKIPVNSYKDMAYQMNQGTQRRTQASTTMNSTSSRAHTIFTICFTIVKQTAFGQSEISSKINLVDLAGSERTGKIAATKIRQVEGCNINLSLLTLGKVIKTLAEISQTKRDVFVPYRDSTLTRLLEDALGGNSKTIMIAALSPAHVNYEETLSTLRYADRAKHIKTVAKKNENPTEKYIRELEEENNRLRRALASVGQYTDPDDAMPVDPVAVQKLREVYEAQLRQNQALMEEKQKTWEERVREALDRAAETDRIANQIEQERKTTPHLLNLSEDPLMSDCLVYILRPGETWVGHGVDQPSDIVLKGASILREHCRIINQAGKCIIEPFMGAHVHVNGKLVAQPTFLVQSDRVIFGSTHVFRFVDPAHRRESCVNGSGLPAVIDWEFAQKELADNLGLR